MRMLLFLFLCSIYTQVQANDKSFAIRWKNFELGATRIQQSSSAYSDGPQLAFTPNSNMSHQDYWLTLRPRLDLQFSKDLAAKVFLIYNLGLQVQINLSDSFYLAPELCLSMATPSAGNKSFTTTGLWLGFNLDEQNDFLKYFDRLTLGYRKLNTEVEASQLSINIGMNFN